MLMYCAVVSSSLSRWVFPAAAALIALAVWIVIGRPSYSAWASPDLESGETSPLGLNVERSGKFLKVSWNRSHPFLRQARQAVLSISEGPGERRVRFDSGELASSTVLYEASANDVVFNLNIRDGNNRSVSESVRAIAAPVTPSPLPVRREKERKPQAVAKVEAPEAEPEAGVIEKALPPLSPRASATIHGTMRIDVKVNVDASGAVSGAELTGPAKSEYFSKAALGTARKWKFAPGEPHSKVIRFEFTSQETRAFTPTQTP